MIKIDEIHKEKYFEEYIGNLSESTKQNYLYYYNKFGGLSQLDQNNTISFLKKYHNSVARAFVKNLIEYCKVYFSDIKNHYGNEFHSNLQNIHLPKIISNKNLSPVEKVISTPELNILLVNLPPEYRAITKVTYYTGLRSHEIRNVKVCDFNTNAWEQDKDNFGRLLVRAEIAKRNKARQVFIIPQLMYDIQNYISRHNLENDDLMFPNINTENDARKWRYHLRRIGLQKLNRGLSPHDLRHSFATNLIKNGLPIDKVSLLLGHKDLSTTQIYTHLSLQDIEEDYKKIMSLQ